MKAPAVRPRSRGKEATAPEGVASRAPTASHELRPRVVFVDDEIEVLRGLRTALHRERSRWDLEFVPSAAEALTVVEAGAVQVVVTDMRMPHMDGEALLRRLQDVHPHVVRIVLSGTAIRSPCSHFTS